MEFLYPRMKVVYAHCYDSYDAVVEPLFHALVYEAFAGKYGVPTPRQACHTYDSVRDGHGVLHYVRVRPRAFPIEAECKGESIQLTAEVLADVELVFKSFGDGIHCLTGGEVPGDTYEVSFHLAEVQVVERTYPSRFRSQFLWLPRALVDYEFVPTPPAKGTA